MMRLGAHAFLWVGEATTEALSQAVCQAAKAEFDFIELPLLRLERIDVIALRTALNKHGLPCTCSLVLPPEASLTENPYAAEEFLLSALNMAARLESPLVTGVIYSKLGENTPPSPEVLGKVVLVLKKVAQIAATKGIRLGIEPVNRYETSLINTAEQALEIINAIAEPNVFLHLDTYHMNIEECGFRQPILKAGKFLQYVHLSESHRGEPGTGNVQWEEVFAALAEVGFKGDVAFEAFLAPSQDLIQATRVWRAISASEEQQIVYKGITFFRKLAKKYGLTK